MNMRRQRPRLSRQAKRSDFRPQVAKHYRQIYADTLHSSATATPARVGARRNGINTIP